MVASLASDKDGSGLKENLSESGRPLMTEDELRRSKKGILIIRDNPPVEQIPVSYSEIDPLRKLADINPHHGKPFLKKVKLRLNLPMRKK
jgi:type IV secretion system protein VirD4